MIAPDKKARREIVERPGTQLQTPRHSAAPTEIPKHTGMHPRDGVLLAAIIVTAFSLRLIYLLQLRDCPTFDHPAMDELYHDQWARAIAAGESFVDGPYFRAPLYPAFLAAVYKLFGHGYLAPRVIQAALGSLSCGLLYLIGRVTFGRAVGTVAGFAAASYWMLIYFDGELLIPTLIVFLDLLLIWVLLRAARRPGIWIFGLVGVGLGLSAIARPNILLFAPVIVVWLLVVHRATPPRAFAYAGCVGVGCLMVITPVTVRNWVVGADLALIATQGGVNFYIGNNPEADGRTAVVPGTPGGWWEGYHATIDRAEQSLGRELRPSEVSRYYFGEALDFIQEQPGKFLSLMVLKLRLFWSHWEISNNKGIYFWTAHFTPVIRWLPLGFGVVGPLAIVGLASCWRRRLELFPLWGFVLVYMVSVLLFFCTARYRMPVLPILILLAVFGGFRIVDAARHRQWTTLAPRLVLLALAVAFVWFTPQTKQFRNDAFSYCRLGSLYAEKGDTDMAIDSYHRALELAPHYLTAHFNLGKLFYKTDRLEEAIAEFRRALVAPHMRLVGEPESKVAEVHSLLARALGKRGRYSEAAEHYRTAIKLAPDLDPGRAEFRLAITLEEAGRFEESTAAFADAFEPLRYRLGREPDRPTLLYMFGRVLSEHGRYDEAVLTLRRCLALESNHLPALDALSRALTDARRYKEAIELLQRANPLRQRWITNRLAFLLATCPQDELRDGSEALRYARQLCPKVEKCAPIDLDVFAAGLAEAGYFSDARTLAQMALDKLRASDKPKDRKLIAPVTERLRTYESRHPYRLPPS